MSPRDLLYVGHMLDTARKAVGKTQGISRESYDADENLRLALIASSSCCGVAWPASWCSCSLPLDSPRQPFPFPLRGASRMLAREGLQADPDGKRHLIKH